jgi:hypothetical protein
MIGNPGAALPPGTLARFATRSNKASTLCRSPPSLSHHKDVQGSPTNSASELTLILSFISSLHIIGPSSSKNPAATRIEYS